MEGNAVDVKKSNTRFTPFHDLMLLREAVAQNPFDNAAKQAWEDIAEGLAIYMPGVLVRTCKDRILKLLRFYKVGDICNLLKFATEEQYEEIEQLLQELKEFEDESLLQVEQAIQSRKRQLEKELSVTATVKAAAVTSINQGTNSRCRPPSPPLLKKGKMKQITDYLFEKHQLTYVLKKQEIELQNRKLDLDERKMSLAEKKFELESERWRKDSEEKGEDRKILMDLVQLALSKK